MQAQLNEDIGAFFFFYIYHLSGGTLLGLVCIT